MQVVDPVARAVVDPQLGHASPNGLDVTRIAADEALDPGENLRPAPQITETRKPSDESLCLADFNHAPTVAPWLRSRNAALLTSLRHDTSFERRPSPARKELHRKSPRGSSESVVAGQVHRCVSQASTQRTSPEEYPAAHSA
jgi:hypothetical protein